MSDDYWTDTVFFKFPDEAAAIAAVEGAQASNPDIRLYDSEEGWRTGSHFHALDLDVPVWEVEPVFDAEGNELVAGVPEAGFFVNVRFAEHRMAVYQSLLDAAVAAGFMELKTPETPARDFG